MTEPTLQERLDRAEAAVTSWRYVIDGIRAHLKDRIAMGDPADPRTYLEIIDGYVRDIERDSQQIVNARWNERAQAADALDAAQAEVERLRAALESAEKGLLATKHVNNDGAVHNLLVTALKRIRAALGRTP